MNFIWFILIGIAAGWLAGQIMKGGGYGLVGDLIVGVIGVLARRISFRPVAGPLGGLPVLVGELIVATVGRRSCSSRSCGSSSAEETALY